MNSKSSDAFADLRRLEHADVQKDFNTAVKAKDFRFLGVLGFTVELPGIEKDQERLKTAYGIKVIEGTSDAITSPEHRRLQDTAIEYARKYNRLLLMHIRQAKNQN